MGLNLSDIKTKRREIAAEQSRGNLWRPGKGSNRVRIATFDSGVTGKTEFFREVWIHQAGKGAPVHVCGNSPSRKGERSGKCPHCDTYNAVVAAEGKAKAQPMKVKKRFVFVCVPVEKMDQPFKSRKPFQFAAAQVVGDAIIKIVSDCDEVDDVNDYFGANGLDFRIQFDPDAPPASMYSVKVLPKGKGRSEPMDPAMFVSAATLDPFADDTHEPAWFLEAQGKAPVVAGEDADSEPIPVPETVAAQVAPASVATSATPAAASKFLSEAEAKAHIAQPGLEGWTVALDPDGDAYFVSPDKKVTQYEAPAVPPKVKKAPPAPPVEAPPSGNFATPEAQMAARGMKPSPKEEPQPPKETDDAAEE